MRFTRHRGTVRADVGEIEAEILAQLAHELLELVQAPAVSDDPLAALVGMSGEDVPAPDDPVLQRLLPDAYRDDEAASGDFRRFTDADLRTRKRDNAEVVLLCVPTGGGRMELDRDQVDAWLGCLTDMRLALGTVLGVEQDEEERHEDDPSYEVFELYSWLGWLQESLLSCVEPRTS